MRSRTEIAKTISDVGLMKFMFSGDNDPKCAMDDWLQAEREWNKALVLQAFDTLF
jgi:hypothetical protein